MLINNPKVEGKIVYHALSDWWFGKFSKDERRIVDERFTPLGDRPHSLTEGKINDEGKSTASQLLSSLATWFRSPDEFGIACRILEKAIELADNAIDLHFSYQGIIQSFYRQRNTLPEALNKTIYYCQKQIDIAISVAGSMKKEFPSSPLPRHVGYERLVIILYKKRNYERAIQLSKKAKLEGWAGDWDKRISKYQKKSIKKMT